MSDKSEENGTLTEDAKKEDKNDDAENQEVSSRKSKPEMIIAI